jgi:hypothetical protein
VVILRDRNPYEMGSCGLSGVVPKVCWEGSQHELLSVNH